MQLRPCGIGAGRQTEVCTGLCVVWVNKVLSGLEEFVFVEALAGQGRPCLCDVSAIDDDVSRPAVVLASRPCHAAESRNIHTPTPISK